MALSPSIDFELRRIFASLWSATSCTGPMDDGQFKTETLGWLFKTEKLDSDFWRQLKWPQKKKFRKSEIFQLPVANAMKV